MVMLCRRYFMMIQGTVFILEFKKLCLFIFKSKIVHPIGLNDIQLILTVVWFYGV